ncbi:MAG: hypothetical protein HXS45_12310, partial [Theionarchaea archaeon]|nr:hypothetical protein [Theionarchaea archaeon]
WSCTYNGQNQLTQIEKNQQLISQYTYDGDGQRITKTEWVESVQEYQTLIYVYSGMEVIYEKNLDTDQEAIYVYGRGGRIAKKVGELIDYYEEIIEKLYSFIYEEDYGFRGSPEGALVASDCNITRHG